MNAEKQAELLINGAFTLGGVILGVLGTLWVARKTKDTKRITLIKSPLAKLLAVGDIIKNRVRILYGDHSIDTLFMGEFALQNSGNLAVEGVKIDIRPANDTTVLNFQVGAANFSMPEKRIMIEEKGTSLDVRLSFLNPGDRLSFTYLSTGKAENPIIDLSQPGLDVRAQSEMITWIPDVYAEVFLEAMSRFWWMDLAMRSNKAYKLYRESKTKK